MKKSFAFVLVMVLGLAACLNGEDKARAKKKVAAKKAPAKKKAHKTLRLGQSAAVKKIYAALHEPTVIDFNDTPLNEVVEYLKDLHKIPIVINTKALDEVGVGTDSPVTQNIRGITLKSALNVVLKELALTWVVRDEVLQITIPEDVEAHMCIHIYDVQSLCKDEQEAEKLAKLVSAMMVDAPAVGGFNRPAKTAKGKKSEKKPTPKAEKPAENGRPLIKAFRRLFIVKGTFHAQNDVDELLNRLATAIPKTK